MQGNWNAGLCRCRARTCWETFWCPSVKLAAIGVAMRLPNLAAYGFVTCVLTIGCYLASITLLTSSQNTDPNYFFSATSSTIPIAICCFAAGLAFSLCFKAVVCTLRSKVKDEFKIEGSDSENCIASFCCTSCALCQMFDHLDRQSERDFYSIPSSHFGPSMSC